ncbi:Polysulphide reductase NrfD [Desulfarculus baarsii DSM 2075]|uniref:Polysulphide reductase NrfD n=1 Tax=Desulfarculus baarsii (strain ATCC 33931 / DSM 2075 / LMG 7858 / VKM B-1802 / 2st14) TaxID=644282 RepID=E1QJ36_DESB2|nr:menaquinone reductase integral membrane subunit QrcD [Desulfarculus baarsii]ADK85579.1 Polysulphide reductase NrfD [Desulfarculus baarsii DSM 2075]
MYDSRFWPKGVTRGHPALFVFWVLICLGILQFFAIGAFMCLIFGLNQTGMNDYYAFGLWIVVDLAVIALGAGAFFTSFLSYILKIKELKNIVNVAVLIGFICYTGAIMMLGIDIGQPIRGWFGFWHANVHSMLTEVMFCITTYAIVLIIELLPSVLENRQMVKVPAIGTFAHNLHRIMIVFAGTGTFLSFFHQGSLGGMFGVLYARPFDYRDGFMIWPWTFFLFILSAIAAGPSFTTLCVMITEKVSGRKLVPHKTKMLMGKISGLLLSAYMVLKLADTYYWAKVLVPKAGGSLDVMYQAPYGEWLLWAELGVCGVLPAIMLLMPRVRQSYGLLFLAMLLNCTGAVLNRFVFTVQSLAIPVLPFEKFLAYMPTWPEVAVGLLIIGYGFLVYSLAYRYLPIFPKEAELTKG